MTSSGRVDTRAMDSRRKPPGERIANARPSGRDLSRDTAPGGPPLAPLSDPGPDPEPAPPRDDGYRYERPTLNDSLTMRLLRGLSAERFPRTATVDQSTSGQLAAHYHAGPRTLPPGASALPEEPSVLLACTSIDEMPSRGGNTLRMRRIDVPIELSPTVVIPRRARIPAWLIAGCGLVVVSCLAILALALTRARSGAARGSAAAPTTAASQAELPLLPSVALEPPALPEESAAALPSTVPPPAPRPSAGSRPRPHATATRPSPREVDVPVSSKLDREE